MEHVSVTNAKADFEQLFERAHGGEEIIVTKWGKPVARIIPYVEKTTVTPNHEASEA